MALETQFNVEKFTGNGVAREWALSFPALKPEHIYLVITDEAAGKITAVDPAQYEVRGVNTPHVSVVYPLSGSPLPSGKRLTIYRLVPHIQPTDFENNDAFLAEVVEWEFDHIVMQIQQLREMIDRAIKVPIGSDKTAEELLAELLEAAEAADRAEAAADRAEAAADLAELKSYVRNIRRSWVADADVAPGEILRLPSPYYPGRAMLLLMHEGTVCAPLDREATGVPQYEEIGDPALDEPSMEVRVHFPVRAGEDLSMWVITSNAWRVTAIVEGYRDEAEAAADRAGESAGEAADAAIRAEEAAARTDLLSAVDNLRVSWIAPADYAIGDTLTLPDTAPYYPGRNMLLLMHQGTVCAPGDQYDEVGDPTLDETSRAVRVFFPIAAGEHLSVWIIASNAWRVSDEVAAALEGTRANVTAAEVAQSAAEAAADVARAKADAILDLDVEAVPLPAGEDADAVYNPETGVLTFSIPKGDTGEQGTGIQIKGTADTPEDLPAQGNEGDVYLVGNEADGFVLYVWDITAEAWHNGGTLGVTLSDSLTSGASTTAASSKAVKVANDNALAAMEAIPPLSDRIDFDSPTTAASSAAVKAANGNALAAQDAAGEALANALAAIAKGAEALSAADAAALTAIWNSITGKPASYPPDAHNHDAGNITSGTLPVGRGGTGATSKTGFLSNFGFGGSAGGNGYFMVPLSNGLYGKVMWGDATSGASGAAVTITFPIAFTNIRRFVATHTSDSTSIVCMEGSTNRANLTRTTVKVFSGATGASVSSQVYISWIAVGI